MQVAVIIPARYGSTRFEGKPLHPILGKPMIQWVYQRAEASGVGNRVVVATDDRRIAEAVRGFGGRAVMTSPENRSGSDRVHEAAKLLGLAASDIVVNVQGDQPVLVPECLQEVVAPLRVDASLGMTTLACAIERIREITDPKDVKVVFDTNGFALYFSRSPIPRGREACEAFTTYKHLGVYAYTMEFLERFAALPVGRLETIEKLEQLRALEHALRVKVVITPHDSPEVDVPEDIVRIEGLLARPPGVSA